MKTYEVTIRAFGVKRTYKTYTVHADSKARAEAVAETAFSQDEPEKYNRTELKWKYEAARI